MTPGRRKTAPSKRVYKLDWPFYCGYVSNCVSEMSFLTIAILLASFARRSAAITRPKTAPKTGPNLALNLRGGGHISDAAIYGGAGLTLVDAVGEFIYPELVVADAKDAEGLVACRASAVWRSFLCVILLIDPAVVHAWSHLANAVALAACAPLYESIGFKKAPLAAWTAAVAVLGAASLLDRPSKFLAAAILVVNGLTSELSIGVNPNYTFRLHDKLPAPKSRVWFHATRNSGAFLAATGLYLALLAPTAPGTTTPALDRADAFGLTMIALTAAMLRFALADPSREGFRRVPRVGVVAWPLILTVAALA